MGPAGSGCARRRLFMECTRRLAALSRAVECLALDFVQKSFGCSSVLLRPQDAELGLGPDQRCRPPPAIRPCCRQKRPRRHRSRPRRPCRCCPRLHFSGLPSPTLPHPPLPAIVAAAYTSHITLCSTTYAAPHPCIRPSTGFHSPSTEVRIACSVPFSSFSINLRLRTLVCACRFC